MLYTMTLSGQEIKDYMEYNYANWYDNMDSGHLMNFKRMRMVRLLQTKEDTQ